MEKKLEDRKEYRSKNAFLKDLHLVFENAKTYNKPNTIYYRYAVNLEEYITPYMEHMTDPTEIELQEYANIASMKEQVQESKEKIVTPENNLKINYFIIFNYKQEYLFEYFFANDN